MINNIKKMHMLCMGMILCGGKDGSSARHALLTAVKKSAFVLHSADDAFKRDRDIVLAAVQQVGGILYFAHDDLKRDRDIVLAAVQQDGIALKYTHDDLKRDRNIVLAAVEQNGIALQFAHDDLKRDRDIVLAAAQQDAGALHFAHDDLQKNIGFLLEVMKANDSRMQRAHNQWRKGKKTVLDAMKKAGYTLHADLQQDGGVAIAAMKKSDDTFPVIDSALNISTATALPTVKQQIGVSQSVPEHCQEDAKVIAAVTMRTLYASLFIKEKKN